MKKRINHTKPILRIIAALTLNLTAALVLISVIKAAGPANIRLEAPEPGAAAQISASAAVTFTFNFTSSYDHCYPQQARAQIPAGYSGAPTPLLIAVHPRTGSMFFGEDTFGAAANAKGWLLASPQLHGNWPSSTPCNAGYPNPNPPGAYSYASLQSQYDIIDTVRYMIANYNVDPQRIYLVGYSMGGQTATVVAAKYPHLFAALFDNKGPTDMYAWYYQQIAYHNGNITESTGRMQEECHIGGVRKAPDQNPFCYQRRSSLNFSSNFVRGFGASLTTIPMTMTHSISDALVPISHSYNLRDVINSYNPLPPVAVFEEASHNPAVDGGPPAYHDYEPDPMAVLNFLEPFRLNNNPTSVNITTDESKSYYWMIITQSGGDHWSQVQAAYNLANRTVTVTISDTNPSALAFNLGSGAITEVIAQPGMGLPTTTYLVKGGGNNKLVDYTSGYLTTTLTFTGQFSLTISGLRLQLSANPPLGQAATSTLTLLAQDYLNNPAPDGAVVTFTASAGTFPNGSPVYTRTISGGQATAVLTKGSQPSQVVASLGQVSALLLGNGMIYLPVLIEP